MLNDSNKTLKLQFSCLMTVTKPWNYRFHVRLHEVRLQNPETTVFIVDYNNKTHFTNVQGRASTMYIAWISAGAVWLWSVSVILSLADGCNPWVMIDTEIKIFPVFFSPFIKRSSKCLFHANIHKNIIYFFLHAYIQGVPKTWDLEDDLGTFNRHLRKN